MAGAYDPSLLGTMQSLPMQRNPLSRIDYSTPTPKPLSLEEILDIWRPFLDQFIGPAIGELLDALTGIAGAVIGDVVTFLRDPFKIINDVFHWIVALLTGGTPPATTGDNPIVIMFERLLGFFGLDWLDDVFDIPQKLIEFVTDRLLPTDLLAQLIDGILPDFQAPQIVADIITAIRNAFAGIPIVGPAVQDVFDVISGLLGIGTNAQVTGTNNAAEIAVIKAGLSGANASGVTFTDTFDRIMSTTLGSGYTQFYAGPGGGTEGLDGTGYCKWGPSGGSARQVINRCNTMLDTDIQYASFVLREPPFSIVGGSPSPRRMLVLRSNAACDTYVAVNIYHDVCNLEAVVAGVSTVGGNISVAQKPGDFWEFLAGDATDPYHYIVKLNGATIIDYVDSSHISQIGSSYLYPGFGGGAGVHLVFVVLVQDAPPDVKAFGTSDRIG